MHERSRTSGTYHPGASTLLAGVGINLILGVLYSWSVLSKAIPSSWHWTEADRSLPYSVACLVISVAMIPAGRLQDRLGPRLVVTVGGLLTGMGMILASFGTTPWQYVIGFGLLLGTGVGFSYSSTTPAALKWFSSSRTGLVAGLIVGAYGLASVYIAPLAAFLLARFGVPATMFLLGLAGLAGVTGLARFLRTPPPGYARENPGMTQDVDTGRQVDVPPGQMLLTWQFYALWFLYACGSGAGLMMISKLAKMVEVQAGLHPGFLLVACLALGNGSGRFLAGLASDRIGRRLTLFACFLLLAMSIGLLSQARPGGFLGSLPVVMLLSALIGANYGANLALFPAMTKDFYGLKHFGLNYGLLFTAWGVSGFCFSLLAGRAYDATNNFSFAYESSAALLLAGAGVTFLVKPPRFPQRELVLLEEELSL